MTMPFPGTTFKVNANELTLGPGTITVLENSFLFEAYNHRHVGFDFPTIRLVRVRDINGFDVAYSFQGSIQRASFESNPRYIRKNEGIENDVASNPLDWTMAFWKLHTITGAVVARTLVDRSGAQSEGLAPFTEEEFELQLRRMVEVIEKLPSQKDVEKTASREVLGSLERQIIEVLLRLTDAWLMGNLSQRQREKVAAMNYRDQQKRYELGWYHSAASEFYSEMTNRDYGENAEDWLMEEKKWGSNLREIISARDFQS